jgi:hypothetical protein
MLVTITHGDGTSTTFSRDFSNGCTARIDTLRRIPLTLLLHRGLNVVEIVLRDKCGGVFGSSPLFLVNTTEMDTRVLFDGDVDGVPDTWESAGGADLNFDGVFDVLFPNAMPGRRDVYVEIDNVAGKAPRQAALNLVRASFAMRGLALHIDDGTRPDLFGAGQGGQILSLPNGMDDFNDPRYLAAKSFDPARLGLYRYGVYIDRVPGGFLWLCSMGLGELWGDEFFLARGCNMDSVRFEAGTFMHELGHTLGLHHGGPAFTGPSCPFECATSASVNHKPNYFSVMNYLFQTGIPRAGGFALDYATTRVPTLDERHLDEVVGVQAAPGLTDETAYCAYVFFTTANNTYCNWGHVPTNVPVNWDAFAPGFAGIPLNSDVAWDLNGREPLGLLTAFSDWDNLRVRMSNSPSVLSGIHMIPEGELTDPPTYFILQHTLRRFYGFAGFKRPIGSGLNVARAGSTIPLKWRLFDESGVPVTNLNPAHVTVTRVEASCRGDRVYAATERDITNTATLRNVGDGRYRWAWNTDRSLAGACYEIRLDLDEGPPREPLLHTARFRLRKSA